VKNWSNNVKIGAGVAAALALAGIGVIVWAVGFQGSSNKSTAGLKATAALAPIGTGSLVGAASVNASLSGPTMQLGGITFAGSNVQSTASLVGPLNQTATPNAKFNFNIPNTIRASFESNGIGQIGSNLVPLGSVISAGDANFAVPAAAGQELSASLGVAPNKIQGLEGGISLSSPSPVASVSSLVSPGELMLAQPSLLRRGAPLTASLGLLPSTATSDGGITFSAANVAPVNSIASAGSMMSSQEYETSQAFSFNVAGANVAKVGLNKAKSAVNMLNTSKVASVSSLVSDGSLMASQSFQSVQSLSGAPTAANSLSTPVASLLKTRSTQSSSVAAAARVGIIFCGGLVNHKCTPQYTSSAPHTASQILVGFLWQGLPAGTKVQLFFIDVNAGKVFGQPSTAFSLPATSGGVILVGFKGPFKPFKLGIGIIINGKRLSGAAVLNIV
jgi:hypothetical protein